MDTVQELPNHITGTEADDLLFGGIENDIVKGLAGDDILFGDLGDDRLKGGDGDDLLLGGPGDDLLKGGGGSNVLFGNAGNDAFVIAGDGDTVVFAEEGDDTVWIIDGDATIHAGDGFDTLSFARANDAVRVDLSFYGSGDGGTFALENDEGSGVIADSGLGEADQIEKVIGTPFNDTFNLFDIFTVVSISGGAGDDSFSGTGVLDGGEGNDSFEPDREADLTGGPGQDAFILNYNFGLMGFPVAEDVVIRDFEPGEDHITFVGTNTDVSLTNEGDIWTLSYFDLDLESQNDVTFQIAGITELDSNDFSFDFIGV
jgi:Ca2+-binding RTX toxin-like protein